MVKFWSITKNTFIQTLRQPIYALIIFITFAALVISLPLSGWTMGTDYSASDQLMLENVGLSTLLVMGLFTAAFSASAALSREIVDKTALTVVSKPVSRGVFVISKFAGVAMAVTLAFYLCSLVFLMTVRHKVVSSASTPIDWPVIVIGCSAFVAAILVAAIGNFMFGWSFVSAACISLLVFLTAAMGLISFIGKGWQLVAFTDTFSSDNIRPQLLVGMYMIFLAALLLTGVAIAASTRVGQIMTILICIFVLVAGSMHPWLINQITGYVAGPGGQAPAVKIFGWTLPNLTIFYPLDALANQWDIPASVVGMVSLYFLCFLGAVLSLGVALFQTRQLEARGSTSTMPSAVSLLSGVGRIIGVVLALIAVLLLTRPDNYTLAGGLTIGGLAVGGFAAWFVSNAFGHSKKWAYWVTMICSVAMTLRGLGVWLVPDYTTWLRWGAKDAGILLITIISGALLSVLLLPKTRNHFKSV